MSISSKRSESLIAPQAPVSDIFIYCRESVLAQLRGNEPTHGFFTLKFYTSDGRLARERTDTISTFYLYPSGGTLRDETMNIALYDSAFDTYRGFVAPHE